AEKVGYQKYHESVDKDGIKKKERAVPHGLLRQLTGRAILFTVKYQEELFSDLINKYNREIEYAKQQGTYDLEIAFLPLDAEVKRRFIFKQGTGGVTAFGRDVIREETIINNLDKPFTVKEINERIVETLAARTNDEYQTRQVTKVDTEYPSVKEKLMARRKESIDQTEAELNQLAEPGSLETEEENKRLAKDRARLEEIIKEKRTGLETYAKELDQIKENLIKYLQYWKVGEVVRVPILGENSVSWGIFLGVRIPDAKNPYTQSNVTFVFAVSDFRKTVVYNLTPEQRANLAHIYAESREIGDVQATEVLQSWNQIIKDSSQKRVKRHILTGNILAASDKIGTINRLVKYNVGRTIQSGILLNASYGKEEQELKALLPINNALELILNLEHDKIFADHQLRVKFRVASYKAFELLVNKKHGYDIYTNERIRSLLLRPANSDELPEFEQVSREMVAYIARDKISALLELLTQLNVQYLGEAQQIETYELDNEEDWQQRTTEDHHVYILTKPFGQGTHPSTGFLEFLSETDEYPYGRVSFNRKLETLERVSYDLIPFFKNPEQPYQQWLETIEKDQAILNEWEKTLEKARTMELSEAYLTLGYFITNHTHENADTRYVFGKYLEEELGEVAYRMLDESPLSKILNQLTIELAA
ncbi:MAG: helicase, partial [Bacteroidota bacterium]